MKTIISALLLLIFIHSIAFGQTKVLKEMNINDIRALDKDKTIVLMPGGILEEHGPHLPTYTDGFVNDYLTTTIAGQIPQEKNGWTVVIFPSIPLGVGGGNHIGLHDFFDGTYHVHFNTFRSIYMDLAYELGKGGFQWIFVFQKHGNYWHNLAIDQASEFFNDNFKGKMVNITGIVVDEVSDAEFLSEEQIAENGFDIHGGFSETSRILFLHPELVDDHYKDLRSFGGKSWSDLIEIGKAKGWPGYFGAPRFASSKAGGEILKTLAAKYKQVILDVLDGKDISSLKTIVTERTKDKAALYYNNEANKHSDQVLQAQQKWLDKKGY